MNTIKICIIPVFVLAEAVCWAQPVATQTATTTQTTAIVRHEDSQVHKLETEIAADRDKIIQEGREIAGDHRKLKDSEKLADKKAAEKIKQEISQDIKKREAVIDSLKKDINNKKNQKHNLLYGKGWAIPKRNRKE